jgi:hypothetical protein
MSPAMMNAKHLTRDPARGPDGYARRVVLALSAAALAGLSACQTPKAPDEPLPAEVARRLETVRGERTDYPSFADVPPAPTDLRTPAQWAEVVGQLEGRGAQVGSWPQRNPAWLTDPEGDARRFQALTAIGPADLPRPDQRERTEAFAETLRQRTVPPAPID